jgi:hypothetical protein
LILTALLVDYSGMGRAGIAEDAATGQFTGLLIGLVWRRRSLHRAEQTTDLFNLRYWVVDAAPPAPVDS